MASLNDLELLYESKCDIHSKIIFCKNNKKGGKVFKYKIDNDTKSWQLVQCLCCQFEEKSMNEEWINSIKQQMDIDKSIDETNNRLSIQPFFSRFCQNTQKISVFASVWPQMNTILAWNFDIEKETFVRSECSKECCQEIVYPNDMTPPSVFDDGAQGKQFARYHRDSYKRQLMCLSITWYDNQNGQMEYFLDSNGDIGRYEWKEYGKFFELDKLLDIKVLPHKYAEQIGEKQPIELLTDSALCLVDTKKCETLDDLIYFFYAGFQPPKQETKIEKFIFDPMNLQFCRIECPCCTTSKAKTSKMDAHLTISTYNSCIIDTKVSIETDFLSRVMKMITTPFGDSVRVKPSPIRNYSHLCPEEFKYRRDFEEKTPKMTQVFQKKLTKDISKLTTQANETKREFLTEAWILIRNRLASDGITKLITYVFMDGSVKEKAEEIEDSEKVLKRNPDERLIEMETGFKRDQVSNVWQSLQAMPKLHSIDYDLFPEYRNYCNHTGHFIITALNNRTQQTRHYVFNPETAHFHRSEYCQECPSYEKGFKIQPCDPIMAVDTSKSKFPYWITTSNDGRLKKLGSDSHYLKYTIEPSKIEKRKENINEIKNSIREGDVVEVPTSQQSPLDTDLTPKYKFYCQHIDDCIIYALNNHYKTRGFYIFNSSTGHLDRTTDCRECTHRVRVKYIEPDTVFMSVMSPHSKWPIMMSTDGSGKLMLLGFQPESNKFEKIGSLNINMKKIKKVEVLTQTKSIDETERKSKKCFMILKPRFNADEENEYCSEDEDEWSDEEEDNKSFENAPEHQKPNRFTFFDLKCDEIAASRTSQDITELDLTPKYRNFCTHTGHFIITAMNNKAKRIGHYVFNAETEQFHHCDYCPKCPPYEEGFKILQPYETIMSIKSSKSEVPYWIKTNHIGRLTLFKFDSNNTHTYSTYNSKIQKKVENLSEIQNSIKSEDVIEVPTSPQSPLNTDLIPKYSYYCPHIKHYPIYALNSYTKTRGFYVFNSTTGHLEQHKACPDCSHRVIGQSVKPMNDFMTAISPYSKWPIMLSTDESGKLVSLGFRAETNKFENMASLSIIMKKKKNIETDDAEDEDDSKSISTAIEHPGIDDNQSSIGSDFSYLKSDLNSQLSEQADSEKLPEEKVIQEKPTAADDDHTCIIS